MDPKEYSILGLTLYLKKQGILVIGDLHIGYEEAMNKEGIMIPRFQFKEIMSSLDAVFKKVKPKRIILLGDVKHEFGTISNQEWHDTLKLLDYLQARSKVILIRGNHDKVMGPIADRKKIEIRDNYSAEKYFFCHGDRTFDDTRDFKKSKAVIIGHEHPAIGIREGARLEKFKCFLFGQYKKKELVVIPSLNLVTEGTDVLKEKTISPFIKKINDFRAVIVSDKAYDFGLIKNLKTE
jgi:uncharacterized protein